MSSFQIVFGGSASSFTIPWLDFVMLITAIVNNPACPLPVAKSVDAHARLCLSRDHMYLYVNPVMTILIPPRLFLTTGCLFLELPYFLLAVY